MKKNLKLLIHTEQFYLKTLFSANDIYVATLKTNFVIFSEIYLLMQLILYKIFDDSELSSP